MRSRRWPRPASSCRLAFRVDEKHGQEYQGDMNLLDAVRLLFNRTTPDAPAQVSISTPATIDPTDRLGDPLASLKAWTIDSDYRRRVNRGELAMPTWALHEALRICPMLGNYARLWCDSIGRLDWSIKTADAGQQAERQAKALRKAYEDINVTQAIRHLALGNIYGYSVLVRHNVEPINWWNVARDGLYGAWKYNPELRLMDGQHGRLEDMASGDYIIREVEHGCLLEFLRIYLRVSEIESYWDGNLEKESRRQVVVVPGQLSASDVAAFKQAATDIMLGRSGTLAGGTGDKRTEVVFPPESRGLPYYENRLKMLDEWACKCLFGAPLVANTAPDSGTLAGNAHADTATTRIMGAAADISAVMQEQFDKIVLEQAGLLQPGESPLAYFQLATKEQADPEKEIDWTLKLHQAGIERDVDELAERTGMKLAPAPASTQPKDYFPDGMMNRAAEAIGVPDSWLGPVRGLINEIADKVPAEITADYLQSVLDEVKKRLPELFAEMDIKAFADVLEQGMSDAALEGVRDAVRKVSKS